MRRAVEGWGLSWMKFDKNLRWRIVAKRWVENTSETWHVCHSVTLTNRHYKYITSNMDIEEVDAYNMLQWNIDTFMIESKNKFFRFTGSLNRCLEFIEWMKKEVEWEDWEWTNGKYGKIDSIEIEEDEDE